MALVDGLEASPARASAAWRERERRARPPPPGAEATVTKGQLPTPMEAGLGSSEPAWKLSGVLDETELQRRQEERMRGDEEDKFAMVSELYAAEIEDNAAHQAELQEYLSELEAAAQEEEASEVAKVADENEELQEEIEALVFEMRVQAQEHALRKVEGHVQRLHQTSLKAERELEHEHAAMQELYMLSVLEQQERILEEQESQKFESCLGEHVLKVQLATDGDDAIQAEADQNEQRQRRVRLLEKEHLAQTEQAAAMERLAAEQEEEDRRNNVADLVGELSDSKTPLRVIMRAATKQDDKAKRELQERHDIFHEQVKEQVVHMHVEAEKARRREWAKFRKEKTTLSFDRSQELLQKARGIITDIDQHVERMDAQFQGIAERRDIWPPGPSYASPHQRSKPRSAGAKTDDAVPASERPGTAPLRARSAARRDMLIKLGRAKAPSGFSYAIRIVFEHMDKQGAGDLDENEMLEGLRLLGLDTTEISLASSFKEVGKTISERIDFQDFEDMVMSVFGAKGDGTEKAATSKPLESRQGRADPPHKPSIDTEGQPLAGRADAIAASRPASRPASAVPSIHEDTEDSPRASPAPGDAREVARVPSIAEDRLLDSVALRNDNES